MKWNEVKRELTKELDRIEDIVESGNYSTDSINTSIKEMYENLIKINNFVKHQDMRIKLIAKKMKSKDDQKNGLKQFVKSMKIAPVDLTTYIDKGWNFMVDQQYDDAVEILSKAYKLAPDDIKTMGLLGWAYIHKEQYDDAMMIFQKVLQLDPENAIAKNNLGFVCFKKGIYGEAIEHLTSVLRSTNDKMSLLYANFYLGLIYLEREMYDDAIRFLLETVKVGPNHVEAYYYLGTAYSEAGMKKKAVDVLSGLIKRNKYNRWAQKAEEKLKEISGEKNEEED